MSELVNVVVATSIEAIRSYMTANLPTVAVFSVAFAAVFFFLGWVLSRLGSR